MSNPAPFFSSIDYWKNTQFQRLIRNWNKYVDYNGDEVNNTELMFEWEEVLLRDFLKHSREWLKENRRKTSWRKELR